MTVREEVLAGPDALARRVADWLLDLARAKQDRFTIALAGGSTPKRLYELLATPPWRGSFPWDRTHLFWGDERFVPQGDPRSNYRMVHEALLAHAPIPEKNIHPFRTEGTGPAEAASAYERKLQTFHGTSHLDPARPLFDVVLLGLGQDGHTASLFPGQAALDERNHWTAATQDPNGDPRLTLTYPPLESSHYVAFLVEGEAKRAILKRVREGGSNLPAARLQPAGETIWFLDRAAYP